MNHLLAISDLSPRKINEILLASLQPPRRILKNQGVALYFEKPSSRTRNSVELAVTQLGGHPVYIRPAELGMGTRESVADVTRTLGCYHALVAARVFEHGLLKAMSDINVLPVLNLLSASDHPLQALADLLTIKQLVGRLEGVKVAFIGEGNNVSRSLAQASALVGMEFTIASPQGYELAAIAGARRVTDPAEAVEGADIVYTDVWFSMGCEESADRRAAFDRYRVDDALMALSANAWFMHCLPARRGEEVEATVIDGSRSAVWQQATNRMHTARGAILWMLEQTQ